MSFAAARCVMSFRVSFDARHDAAHPIFVGRLHAKSLPDPQQEHGRLHKAPASIDQAMLPSAL
ncbi:hypothetical protein C7H84_28720 [Burkholderia sp. Nafp2/4-1b]|nr:hypothetical protein C7H84_28720 [Burkholderia sp. Nafp2/4-1b]